MQRARIAFNVFRAGYPRAVKQAPFYFPSWRSGVPQWQIIDFTSYVTDGFQRNSLIYEALMYKVKSTWIAPLRAYSGDADHPQALPLDHPWRRWPIAPIRINRPGNSWAEYGLSQHQQKRLSCMLDRPQNTLPKRCAHCVPIESGLSPAIETSRAISTSQKASRHMTVYRFFRRT
jgi:hypothetical protein